uniref:Uncharacterized protein n=1 Tax=Macaca fascicularis TaxID=9541 RepID=A0A7N9CP42_MACFA
PVLNSCPQAQSLHESFENILKSLDDRADSSWATEQDSVSKKKKISWHLVTAQD